MSTQHSQAGARFASFREFYPFYLSEHANRTSRRLHFLGTGLFGSTALFGLATQRWLLAAVSPIFGYAFAWIGHFFFERNKPATFRHPFYSLLGDFAMFRDIVTRRIPW